jgi:hypothetical protein
MTTAQSRYDSAVAAALVIIAETSDGDRSTKLYRAGVHVGKFAHWGCADPGIAQRLFHEARASGAKDDAIGHIERGIADGRKSPNAEPVEKTDEKPRETLAELFDRKRISRGVISAYGIREYQGALYYPVPPMPVERIRFLTKPAEMRWRRPGLEGVPVQLPYGMAQLRGTATDPIYVVNGESGVWAGWTAGVDAVCFCRGEGAAPSETQAGALADTGRPIRIVYDLDRPGERGSAKVAAALTAAGCVDVLGMLLPEELGAKGDFGDLWVKCGADKDAFRAVLESLPERGAVAKPPTAQPDLPEQQPPATNDYLTRACPGIPAPRGVKVPYGYILSSEGVHKLPPPDEEDEMPRLICGGPIAIVGYSRDKDLGTMTCTIAYRRPHDPTWYTHECDRATLMEARKVSSLSAVGVPVTSGQSASLVQYFAASEAALSEGGLPVSVMTSAMGWHGNTFVRGTHSHGDAPRLRLPPDSALRSLAESVGVSGEWETWKAKVWSECATRPTLRLMIAASVVPAIMRIIECPSFAVDICGGTSQGKTTAMLVAASVWGSHKFCETWDSTPVGVENLCNLNRCMPSLLDDTRNQVNPAVCAHVVFAIVSGRGRKRGAANGGMRATAEFETVILSTGEGALKDMAQIGGLAARCLPIWGSPMGGKSAVNAAAARALKQATRYHYGHIGAAVVDHLMRMTKDERAELRQRYARYIEWFSMRATGGSDVAQRLAEYAAAIAVAGKLIAKVMGLPLDTVWVTSDIWATASESSATADRATAALQDLASHVAVNSGRVYVPRKVPSSHVPDPTAPHQGWIAHRVPDGALSVPVTIAREFLTRAGYACGEVISSWRERGWIESSSPRGTRSVRFGEQVVTCYSLTAASIATAAGQDSGATELEPDDDADNPLAF